MIANRRAGGFTLLEMLVSITVLTLLVSLVYGMLRIGSRSWESVNGRIDSSDSMRIGWTFLQRALNNARAVPIKIPDTDGIHFVGKSDALEFVTDLPAYLGTGGLHAIIIELDDAPDADNEQLVLLRIPLGDYENVSQGNPDDLQKAILAEGVSDLEIEYFGPNDDAEEYNEDEQATWTSDWQDKKGLPLLVRLKVGLDDGSSWPLLVAHPRLGANRQDTGRGEDDLERDSASIGHETNPAESSLPPESER